MIVRIFDTAVNPEDVERGMQVFREQVKPFFDKLPGCLGIEMLIGAEEVAGGEIEVAAVSRWESLGAVQDATSSPEYDAALAEFRALFEKTPIVRHYETVD
ncbi:MAG: antibiotic biosynthesis monooxygenase [Actinomycetota bacterium]